MVPHWVPLCRLLNTEWTILGMQHMLTCSPRIQQPNSNNIICRCSADWLYSGLAKEENCIGDFKKQHRSDCSGQFSLFLALSFTSLVLLTAQLLWSPQQLKIQKQTNQSSPQANWHCPHVTVHSDTHNTQPCRLFQCNSSDHHPST